MINISIFGALGRMGQNVIKVIKEDKDLSVAGLIEHPKHEGIGTEISGLTVTSDIKDGIRDADVVIDFSTAQTTLNLIKVCKEKGKKIVIGTTGFSDEQMKSIKKCADEIPVLLSPNMSLGVNLVFKIAGLINETLADYEKEIIELHHNKKLDAPSGTAMRIAEIISGNESRLVHGRTGTAGPRDKKEIGIHAVRAGNIIGEHTVMWVSPYERIELTHKAQSREVFAVGAVKAAIWLENQSPGKLYSMEDVIN